LNPRADAIVVAAGSSARMGGADKLLATIGGRPLLAHTLAALTASTDVASLVVVTSPDRRRALADASWLPDVPVTFVDGGTRRQDSVRAGFEALERTTPDPEGRRVVLVHDGARPLVSAALVSAVVASTALHGAAIPVVPVTETIKRVAGDVVEATVDRAELAAAQTPQGVLRGLLRDALGSKAASATWTDEAALLEVCRIPVHVVPGDPSNLKVTVPDDLARAAALLGQAGPVRRTGIGHDAHPFGPGGPLRLGGLDIPGAPRLHGHSDGDVVLHAVADALLGAAGMGDLGRLFPAGPSTPRGVDSRELLAAVVARLAGDGWRPVAVDLTIVAARPHLGAHLDGMRTAIAALLGIEPSAVNVKASTGNLDGSDGAGRSVSTLALATIEGRS
jgi:2-C-methyl-D-erythritol 4-phosphate cytidylyltransferase/2-C-methyl-D-erythritol 2,4-cyclodiphosphate synthase